MKNNTCAFTGHRPFKLPWGFEEDHPDCVRLKLMLGMEIESRIASGCCNFLSGMSWGADIWCAEIVLNLRQAFPERNIRLTAVLPFEEYHAGWTKDYQERYFSVLENADKCTTLYSRFFEGCYQERNRYMIDRSQYLIAVFNGKAGGTANTIEYARHRRLDIILFDPVRLSREHILGQRHLQAVKLV